MRSSADPPAFAVTLDEENIPPPGTRRMNAARIELAHWESENFGFPVARLLDVAGDPEEVDAALTAARSSPAPLVVWSTKRELVIARDLLARHRGVLADRKATFRRSLDAPSAASPRGGAQVRVEPYAGDKACPHLVALALASGVYSRFRVDPRFPRPAFEKLYRIWIERSVRGELADMVLVARHPLAPGGLAGFVTLQVSQQVGKIGLVAVSEAVRGRGIARELLAHAHAWMTRQRATEAAVVTQLANQPACELYKRCGYHLAEVEQVYHFWPHESAVPLPLRRAA